MKKYYYLVGVSLGYVGTDETYLVEENEPLSQEDMDNISESYWWEHFNSSGAVFDPDLEAAVDAGEMTEEEAEEQRDNAFHGMVVSETDYWMTLITKENLEDMMEEFAKSYDYTEEKEEEIRKAVA